MRRSGAVVLLVMHLAVLTWVRAQEGQQPQGQQRNTPTTHTIRGRVYLPSGFPAQNQMRVTLRTVTQAIVQESFTDSVGNFEFRNIPGGSYEIVVWGDDQSEATVEKIEIMSRVARTFSANIFLRAKPEEAELKPKGGVVSMSQLDPNVPRSARREYERGVKEVERHDYDKAIEHLERAVELYPKYFQALNDLGVQYSRKNRFQQAEDSFNKAVALDPRAPFPHLNLGYMRLTQKQYEEAVRVLTHGVELDAMNWAGHMWLGVALMETRQFELSRDELQKALSLGTPAEVSSAHLYLANLYIRQGDLLGAIEQSELYLKESPKAENPDQVKEKIAQMRSLIERGQNRAP